MAKDWSEYMDEAFLEAKSYCGAAYPKGVPKGDELPFLQLIREVFPRETAALLFCILQEGGATRPYYYLNAVLESQAMPADMDGQARVLATLGPVFGTWYTLRMAEDE